MKTFHTEHTELRGETKLKRYPAFPIAVPAYGTWDRLYHLSYSVEYRMARSCHPGLQSS